MHLLQLASEATSLPHSFWEPSQHSPALELQRELDTPRNTRQAAFTPSLVERVERIAREAVATVKCVAGSSPLSAPHVDGQPLCTDTAHTGALETAASQLLPEIVALVPPLAACGAYLALLGESSRGCFQSLPHLSSFLDLTVSLLHRTEHWASLTDDEFAATARALQAFGSIDAGTAAAAANALLQDGRIRQISLRHLVEIASSTLHAQLLRKRQMREGSLPVSRRLSCTAASLAVVRKAAKAAQDRLLRERRALVESGMMVRAWQTMASLSVLSHAATVRAQAGFFLLLEGMRKQQGELERHAPLLAPLLPDEELAALPPALSAAGIPDERLFVWAAEQIVVRLGGPSLRQLVMRRDAAGDRSGNVSGAKRAAIPAASESRRTTDLPLCTSHTRLEYPRDSKNALRRQGGQATSWRSQEKERLMASLLLQGMGLWERVGPPGMQQQALPIFCQAFLLPNLPHLPSRVLLHLVEAATAPRVADSLSFSATSFAFFIPSSGGHEASRGTCESRREAKQRRRQLLQERQDTLGRLAAGALGLLLEPGRRTRFECGHLVTLLRAARSAYQAQMLPRRQHLSQLLTDKRGCLLELEAALIKGVPLLYRDIALQLRLFSRSCPALPLRASPLPTPVSGLTTSDLLPTCGAAAGLASRPVEPPLNPDAASSAVSSPAWSGSSSGLVAPTRHLQRVSGEEGIDGVARRLVDAVVRPQAYTAWGRHASPVGVSELVQVLQDAAVLTGLLPAPQAPPMSAVAPPSGAPGRTEAPSPPDGFLLSLLSELLPLLGLASAGQAGDRVAANFGAMTQSQVSDVMTSCAALLLRLVGSLGQQAKLDELLASLGLSGTESGIQRERLECCRLLVLQICLRASDARVDAQAAAVALRALLACLHRVPAPLLSDWIVVHPLGPLSACARSSSTSERAPSRDSVPCGAQATASAPESHARSCSASAVLVPAIAALLCRLTDARASQSRGGDNRVDDGRGGLPPDPPTRFVSPSGSRDVDACRLARTPRSAESESGHVAARRESNEGQPDDDGLLSHEAAGLRLNAVVPALAAAAWLEHQRGVLCRALAASLQAEEAFGESASSAPNPEGAPTQTCGRITLTEVNRIARYSLENVPFVAALPECIDTILEAAKTQFSLLPDREVRLLELHLRAIHREKGEEKTADASGVFKAIECLLEARWAALGNEVIF
ncbi:conserved hypothetical protein [Neospora caninum Liverpool]|nr:conserved hypothetical protein [Neospora caninum Liverpool]CBZ49899.1 conserved hypothetical protein [Neospora caninum Liverpool]|eukprot:XP_003879934.1 conserved hypothetical protein [Neospora caninum Liverpool]